MTLRSGTEAARLAAKWTAYDRPEIERSAVAPSSTPMYNLRRIRLELNRSAEFPKGSHLFGYEFVAPLDSRRHIDIEQWRNLQQFCEVRSFRPGREDCLGRLVHCADSDDPAFWVFDHGAVPESPRQQCRFGAHVFVPGEYVSIRNANAQDELFRVIAVSTLR